MELSDNISQPITGAGRVVSASFWSLLGDPQILLYALLAPLAASLVGALLGGSIFAHWYSQVFSEASAFVPNKTGAVVGLVTFAAFYTALITAYFNVAVSSAVMAKLEGRSTYPLSGMVETFRHFFRVSRFAVLSVFLFPVGIYVQRRKLPKGILGVLGSSLTLHMASLAPEILSGHNSFGNTVRNAIDTLGKKWKEGLVLKIGMYAVFTLIVILPKLLQHGFSASAANAGWLITLELGASSYAFFKVLNSIFTTVLYHHAKQLKK